MAGSSTAFDADERKLLALPESIAMPLVAAPNAGIPVPGGDEWPAIGPPRRRLPSVRSLLAAAELEVERGILFLLVPVLLAAGSATYFGLRSEPDGHRLVALLVLLSFFAWLASRHGRPAPRCLDRPCRPG
jgi:competence protein ComEC